MVFWNFSEPELIPKGNTLKQNRLHSVMNVVKGLDSLTKSQTDPGLEIEPECTFDTVEKLLID